MDISTDKHITKIFDFNFSIRAKMIILAFAFAFAATFFSLMPYEWSNILAIVLFTVTFHLGMRLIIYYSVLLVIKGERVKIGNPWLREKKWERKLFKYIGVRGFKDKFPSFFSMPFDPDGINELILDTVSAEIAHTIVIALSYLPLVAVSFLGDGAMTTAMSFVSIFAGLIDFYALCTQRLNRSRLIVLQTKLQSRRQI